MDAARHQHEPTGQATSHSYDQKSLRKILMKNKLNISTSHVRKHPDDGSFRNYEVQDDLKYKSSIERRLSCSENPCPRKLCSSSLSSLHDPAPESAVDNVLRLRGGGNSDDESSNSNFTFANSDSNDEFSFANSESDDNDSEKELKTVGNTAVADVLLNKPLPTIYYSQIDQKNQAQTSSSSPTALCSKNCNLNCRSKTASWTLEDKEEIIKLFAGLNVVQQKNRLLMQIYFQRSSGLPTTGFFFKEQLLCVNYFSSIVAISPYLLTKVLRDFCSGYQRYTHGNSSKKKCQAAVINFCAWMKLYALNFGQDGPTDIVTILPSFLNKADLFKIYRRECPEPHVKKSTMYKLMKSRFGPKREFKELPWIRISKFSTHSKCDVCLGLDQFMRKAKTPAEVEYGRGLKLQHSNTYSQAWIAISEFIQKSITFPKEVVAFQLDSMDNSKSMLPRVLERSKQLSGMFKLPCKITGCVTSSSLYPGNRKIKFYSNHGEGIFLDTRYQNQCLYFRPI